jgi:hypothetical protein
MATIIGPPGNVIRNRPITTELRVLLDAAADSVGVERVVIVSGGQTSNHAPELKGKVGGWIGSRRHDDGRAADIKNGMTLSFTDTDGSQVESFVTAAAARGANGIGAGVNYMGTRRIHVGFGVTPSDHSEIAWGAAGAAANAPAWLREASGRGWANPFGARRGRGGGIGRAAGALDGEAGMSVVRARGGLWLRKGPGLEFDRTKLLELGTELMVLGMDGPWARVDLEGDGFVDGHVMASFLSSAHSVMAGEGIEEPVDPAAPEEPVGEAEPVNASARDRRGRRPPGPRPPRNP